MVICPKYIPCLACFHLVLNFPFKFLSHILNHIIVSYYIFDIIHAKLIVMRALAGGAPFVGITSIFFFLDFGFSIKESS